MPDAKVQFSLGSFSFSGEGDDQWVAAQLDKVLEKAASLANIVVSTSDNDDKGAPKGGKQKGDPGTLAAFLASIRDPGQNERFLGTAEWLHRRGQPRLKTAQVTKALRDNNQKKLGNPADCLKKNIGKGYCEKVGDEFFVTDDGRNSLGNV